jgi:hypothetical protein
MAARSRPSNREGDQPLVQAVIPALCVLSPVADLSRHTYAPNRRNTEAPVKSPLEIKNASSQAAGLKSPQSRSPKPRLPRGTGITSSPVAQRINQQGKGWRGLATARVVEMVARKAGTPVLKDPLKASFGDMLLHQILRYAGHAESGQCRSEHRRAAAEHPLALNVHFQFMPSLREFPGKKAAIGRQPHIDAVVRSQVLGFLRSSLLREVARRGNDGHAQVRCNAHRFEAADAVFADGQVRWGDRYAPLVQAAGEGGLTAEDAIEYGDLHRKYQQSTFGAHFVEVGVDAATGEIRVRRMLAVCAAGRILNPKSARSQVIGAMTMGVGAALMEELAVDKRLGFFVNHDLAGYEVPVHADIPHQEVIFLDETDPMFSPMKAKGVAELGIWGWLAPSRTQSTTPPACAYATIRSRSTNFSPGCRKCSDCVRGRKRLTAKERQWKPSALRRAFPKAG